MKQTIFALLVFGEGDTSGRLAGLYANQQDAEQDGQAMTILGTIKHWATVGFAVQEAPRMTMQFGEARPAF